MSAIEGYVRVGSSHGAIAAIHVLRTRAGGNGLRCTCRVLRGESRPVLMERLAQLTSYPPSPQVQLLPSPGDVDGRMWPRSVGQSR